MSVDIDHLDLEQLYDLNDRVIDRIKRLESMKAQMEMMAFDLGARVSFDSKYGPQIGTVMKFNRKTVVVHTDDGRAWKISPGFLKPLNDVEGSDSSAIYQKTISKKNMEQ